MAAQISPQQNCPVYVVSVDREQDSSYLALCVLITGSDIYSIGGLCEVHTIHPDIVPHVLKTRFPKGFRECIGSIQYSYYGAFSRNCPAVQAQIPRRLSGDLTRFMYWRAKVTETMGPAWRGL